MVILISVFYIKRLIKKIKVKVIYLLIITINPYNFILAHGFYSVKYFCTIS